MFENNLLTLLLIAAIFYLLFMSNWRIHNNYRQIVIDENKVNQIGYNENDNEGFIGSITEKAIQKASILLPFELKMKNKKIVNKAIKNNKKASKIKKIEDMTMSEHIMRTLVDLPRNILFHY